MKKQNPIALLPIAVFLVLYLGLGILFEYVMKIPMGFYNVPIIIAFLVAILVACLQNRSVKFDQKLEIMAQGLADKNIITMLLIFLTAGAFVGVVGRSSAESVAYFMLSLIPARFAVMVLFVVACFVSIAMGTSVGTITLIVPIAAAVSDASGFGLPLCIGSVMGGAMFGDNLSFISDTTIAACNGQGCQMKDKFRENFFIALPAAVMTLVVIAILSFMTDIAGAVSQEYHLLQIVPYILVLFGGIAGINVFVVLIIAFFVKHYSEYYKGRCYHKRSLNSNDGWNSIGCMSFMNQPILKYSNEIRSAVLIVHGEKAHSYYFGKDAYENMIKDSKYTSNKELLTIPGAVHTDLYDNLDVIPFDKIQKFFEENGVG